MSFVSFDVTFSPVFQYSDQWMVIFFLRDSIVSWMMHCSSMRDSEPNMVPSNDVKPNSNLLINVF